MPPVNGGWAPVVIHQLGELNDLFWVLLGVLLLYFSLQMRKLCKKPLFVRSMQVKERYSGRILDENVPPYVKAVYQAMYGTKLSRQIVSARCTNQILKRGTLINGKRMDRPVSVKQLQRFITTYQVDASEAEKEVKEYKTFNEFFSRKLKPGLRPIAAADDPTVFVSPADCRLMVFPSLEMSCEVWLKGEKLTVADLLGDDFDDVAAAMPNPAVIICRLAPGDYHRWAMPCTAITSRRHVIEGTYFSVSPRAVRKFNILATNKREVCLLDSREFGPVVLVAVGASMVSSICITAPDGQMVAKGDEHGYFSFGGSTLVLLLQRDRMELDQDLLENSLQPIATHVKVGMRIGVARARP